MSTTISKEDQLVSTPVIPATAIQDFMRIWAMLLIKSHQLEEDATLMLNWPLQLHPQ